MINQSAQQFLMIKPDVFGFNSETCRTNHYQRREQGSDELVYDKAMKEFDGLYKLYQQHNIDVKIFENHDKLALDAIFPNSFSTFPSHVFWEEGKEHYTILHPMLDLSRRRERSDELVKFFTDKLGYKIKADLSHWEQQNRALEGTGSVVMDHVNKVAYCGLSERSNEKIAVEFAKLIGYDLVTFRTRDHHGIPIYHTDLVMYVGSGYIGICADCIHEEDRDRVLERAGHFHKIVRLAMGQLRSFCGNAVEMRNKKGQKFLAMSYSAFAAMLPEQKNIIAGQGVQIIHADISTIEKNGGGSVRCMTQELF